MFRRKSILFYNTKVVIIITIIITIIKLPEIIHYSPVRLLVLLKCFYIK